MTNSEMHSAQRSTYSSVEDAALMRLLPDAAEAQVFSECVGNLQKSCATKLDMNLKRAKVLAYWSLRVASAERAHEILVFLCFSILFVHFLSFFVLSGFMFRGSDTPCKGPYKNLEPGGKASVNIRAKEALGSKQSMFCIAFDVSFLILFCSRPAASLLTVSRCYAEQRSEGSVMRWCFFNTQPPF